MEKKTGELRKIAALFKAAYKPLWSTSKSHKARNTLADFLSSELRTVREHCTRSMLSRPPAESVDLGFQVQPPTPRFTQILCCIAAQNHKYSANCICNLEENMVPVRSDFGPQGAVGKFA